MVGVPIVGRQNSTAMVPFRNIDGRAIPTRWTGAAMMRGLADADGMPTVPPHGVSAGRPAAALSLHWRTNGAV
jgi:molybdopterin molybdotransferase